jgi:hypothetical protein
MVSATILSTVLSTVLWVIIGAAFAPAGFAHDTELGDSILDHPDYDPSVPWYQALPPSWSLHLKAAVSGLPSAGNGNLYQLGLEWLIPWQKIGVFSIGANLGILPLEGPSGSPLSGSNLMNAFAGGQLRYQLRVFNNQLLVPTATLTYDYYRLKLTNPAVDFVSGSQMGMGYGVMLNLGWIDPITSRGAYQSLGLTRFYLTTEIFQSQFSNFAFNLNSRFYLFGIRAELE